MNDNTRLKKKIELLETVIRQQRMQLHDLEKRLKFAQDGLKEAMRLVDLKKKLDRHLDDPSSNLH